MLNFICDYAKASPVVVANKIEKFFDLGNSPVWCNWKEVDEDRFQITVYHPLKGVNLTLEEKEVARSLIDPYLCTN